MKRIIVFMMTLVFIFTSLLVSCTGDKLTDLHESSKDSNKELQSELNQYMDELTKSYDFGCSILISKDNDIILDRGYGMADYDNKIVNDPHTVFGIGSLTKQFTATAILMLQEKKLLNVQDPINKYISDYPNGEKIKIHNLLSHTSGIPEYSKFVDSFESGTHSYTTEEIIELFKNKPLNFDVGTSFEYSNSNYVLLGYIIEKVSKMKYEDYIDKNILEPLNLKETSFLSRTVNIKNKAVGYENINVKSNIYTKAKEMEPSLQYSDGEICSTVEDLYRWENALFSEKLINKESLNMMFTPNLNTYGYGWYVKKDNIGNYVVGHTGGIPGYTSLIIKNINKNYLIILLINTNDRTKLGAFNSICTKLPQILNAK